jgi:nucleotide-binding universal stress UspA family protein
MVRTILIGLDGSPDCDRAVEQGILWAKMTGAELIGVAIVDEPTICRPEPTGMWGSHFKASRDRKLLADARTKVHHLLEGFAACCRTAGVRFQVREETGLPAERLTALNEDADLTLLGIESHFHFQTQREPDDTLKDVLRKCHRPVVAFPGRPAEGQSVLVAYDGSQPAARALAVFANSGLAENRPVQVVSMARHPGLARRRVDEAARYLGHFGIRSEVMPLVGGRASDRLLGQVCERHPALVVMGAFGGQRSEGFLGRSTTRRMLRKANVPLFLHP